MQKPGTQPTPSPLTVNYSRRPLWRVESQVQRTDFTHRWAGEATDSGDARRKALDCARRDWPGFSFAVRAVVQVA